MVDSLTVNEEDQNSDELNFVEPSDSQSDEGDDMDYKVSRIITERMHREW